MATIFISYSSDDWKTRDLLVPQIRNAYGDGSYWYDKGGLRGADNWWKTIENEIRACQVFLYLMSDTALSSENCINELRLALQHNKQIIQVLLPTLTTAYPLCIPEDLREELRKKQYVDLREEYIAEYEIYKDLSRVWGALNKWISNSRAVLTTTERWLLHNQFEILKQLNPDHPDYDEDFFKNAAEILASGYEWYYNDISQYIYTTTFPHAKGQEIADILDMFRFLRHSYEELDDNDKSEIDERSLEFVGFDGNNETVEMQFAEFMMKDMKTYDYLMPEHGINSHYSTLDMYRRMLREWNNSEDEYYLSKDDLIRIGKARYPKS